MASARSLRDEVGRKERTVQVGTEAETKAQAQAEEKEKEKEEEGKKDDEQS